MATPLETVKRIVRHPLTVFSAAFAAASSVFNMPLLNAVSAVAWSYATELFAVVSVAYTQFAPRVEWLPEDDMFVVFVLAGLLFGAAKLAGPARALIKRLRGGTDS